MKAENIEMKIVVRSDAAIKQIERATKAAQKLVSELNRLEHIEIGIKFIEVQKKWWHFWK
tara:strand:+ start:1151 stop:1330 length:180 start_codon:yes stop_codon:yes gene_type:complete